MELDLDAAIKELEGKSQEDLFAELLEIKTKQRVQAKKNYKPEIAKKARLKRMAYIKALTEKARAAGVYDKLMEAANAAAAEKLGTAEGESADVEEETAA